MNPFARLELLIGSDSLNSLKNATVAVIGLGGVGGMCLETLARSGVGNLIIQDYDVVEQSNINRQVIADGSSIGKKKTVMFAERIGKINPDCAVTVIDEPFNNDSSVLENRTDYLADAIDDIGNKYLLIKECLERQIPFISSMGMARKLDWRKIAVTDIRATTHDPIARVIRKKLREDNITATFPVVTSTEKPLKTAGLGSYMPVVAIAGIVMADYIIKKIISG